MRPGDDGRPELHRATSAFVMVAVAQAQDSPRKELRRVDLSGAAGMEVISSISEFKPGDEFSRHLHHGVEVGVVTGAICKLAKSKARGPDRLSLAINVCLAESDRIAPKHYRCSHDAGGNSHMWRRETQSPMRAPSPDLIDP
jgi:hypothetical protein